jgi:nicotinamidase/pyrazinamidase
MKSLILIDMQLDFMPGGALAVPRGDEIIPLVNQLQDKFELIIATQDWHPENHISFASNHENKKPFDIINLEGIDQVLWPDHCVQNTKGANFHPHLEMKNAEAIFRKGMNWDIDSYSGFYDNKHKKSTGLAGYLHEKNVNELYFCGLAADYCVYFSIKDALKEGFSAILIEDATRPINPDDFIKIKEELTHKGCKIITSKDI